MNTNETQNTNTNAKPDMIAKVKERYGKNVSFETVGVAWTREDGSIYFKPYGTQVISSPIYLFKTNQQQDS